jgi:hypothetical protein
VDSGGGLIGKAYLNASNLLGSLASARFQHQLQRANTLVRSCDRAAGFIGFAAREIQPCLLRRHLRFAPLEEPFEVAEQRYRQRDASERSLSRVHLSKHHAHARLRCLEQAHLLGNDELSLGQSLAFLVELALSLLACDLQRRVRPAGHHSPVHWQLTRSGL